VAKPHNIRNLKTMDWSNFNNFTIKDSTDFVDSKTEIIGDKIVLTFQSRINYEKTNNYE
jgi:hypothetical protein